MRKYDRKYNRKVTEDITESETDGHVHMIQNVIEMIRYRCDISQK